MNETARQRFSLREILSLRLCEYLLVLELESTFGYTIVLVKFAFVLGINRRMMSGFDGSF